MNGYRRLTLFVEGRDDRRFAENVILPLLKSLYDDVEVHEYAQKPYSPIRSFISDIRRTDYREYLFVADFDEGPCVTRRKEQLVSRYGNLDVGRTPVSKTRD